MKCLITGGCGFLGSNIAAEIIRGGDLPVIVDNLSRFGSDKNLEWLQNKGNVKFISGDVSKFALVDEVISATQPDVVFHLAGQVAMTTSLKDPRRDFEINAIGTLNVLEALRQFCPDAALIYSSTNKVYGDLEYCSYFESDTRYKLLEYPNGLPESIQLDFHSPYGCSKGSADQYVLDYARMFGMKTTVFRHSSMYGGRQFSTIDQGWIGWFCQQAIFQSQGRDEPFTVSGNGKQVRDVLYCDDMVRLYLMAANQISSISGQAFNVGGGMDNSLSIIELFQLLESLLNVRLNWKHIDVRESDQKVFVADLSKISSSLGWVPKVNKYDGINKMLEWLMSKKPIES